MMIRRAQIRTAAVLVILCAAAQSATAQIAADKFADLTMKLLASDANLEARVGGASFGIVIASEPDNARARELLAAFVRRASAAGALHATVSAIAVSSSATVGKALSAAGPPKVGCIVAVDLSTQLVNAIEAFCRNAQVLSVSTNKDDVDPLSLAIVLERGQIQIYRSDPSLRAEGVRLSGEMLDVTRSRASVDYRENYREAIKAVDFKNWKEAARRLQNAISGKSTEGETVMIYGLRNERYLPHFYLGLALLKLGDCEGALAAWTESERQGAIRTAREYNDLAAYRAEAQQEPACRSKKRTSVGGGAAAARIGEAATQ